MILLPDQTYPTRFPAEMILTRYLGEKAATEYSAVKASMTYVVKMAPTPLMVVTTGISCLAVKETTRS